MEDDVQSLVFHVGSTTTWIDFAGLPEPGNHFLSVVGTDRHHPKNLFQLLNLICCREAKTSRSHGRHGAQRQVCK